jgi:hypothetical protein
MDAGPANAPCFSQQPPQRDRKWGSLRLDLLMCAASLDDSTILNLWQECVF